MRLLILLTTLLLCVPGILSQDLNCDENTEVHVVLKLFNVQGNAVTGLAMNAENSAGNELMSEQLTVMEKFINVPNRIWLTDR